MCICLRLFPSPQREVSYILCLFVRVVVFVLNPFSVGVRVMLVGGAEGFGLALAVELDRGDGVTGERRVVFVVKS